MCAEYATDGIVKQVVDNVHLFLIPTMNPDGFKMKRRESS
jgi:murein tripeptide amidase MpaA